MPPAQTPWGGVFSAPRGAAPAGAGAPGVAPAAASSSFLASGAAAALSSGKPAMALTMAPPRGWFTSELTILMMEMMGTARTMPGMDQAQPKKRSPRITTTMEISMESPTTLGSMNSPTENCRRFRQAKTTRASVKGSLHRMKGRGSRPVTRAPMVGTKSSGTVSRPKTGQRGTPKAKSSRPQRTPLMQATRSFERRYLCMALLILCARGGCLLPPTVVCRGSPLGKWSGGGLLAMRM
mmetsp:Transcript_12920/g.36838  ORF Transcript_12920/g.36838 Transcript_12920/m.36838 type:complete len:238 (-) Transcript_12920:782-1495(-)